MLRINSARHAVIFSFGIVSVCALEQCVRDTVSFYKNSFCCIIAKKIYTDNKVLEYNTVNDKHVDQSI